MPPILSNILLQEFCKKQELNGLIITSQDPFLSEYTSQEFNMRYFVSGFTGSRGDGIFIAQPAHFILFVDGRYHIQAQQQCDNYNATVKDFYVEIVKLSTLDNMQNCLIERLKKEALLSNPSLQNPSRWGVDMLRTPWQLYQGLQSLKELGLHSVSFFENEIAHALHIKNYELENPGAKNLNKKYGPTSVPFSLSGRSLEKNLQDLFDSVLSKTKICFITCAADDTAWLLNARSYALPYSAGVLGYTFCFFDEIFLFLPEGIYHTPVHIPSPHLKVFPGSWADLKQALVDKNKTYGIEKIVFSPNSTNAFLPYWLKQCWPEATFQDDFLQLIRTRSRKTPEEQAALKDAFLRSSRAIAKTLRWLKQNPASTPITEKALSQALEQAYQQEGSVGLSFKTIAATGPHSAIVHYTDASDTQQIVPGSLTLLDSGAYYPSGLATDCTRTVFYSGQGTAQPTDQQKKIYTLTLKAQIAGLTCVFPKDTLGKTLDHTVRSIISHHGYDYKHGTGHGVGIHVHEEGVRISQGAQTGFAEHQAVSMEPGIYLEQEEGVRLENVVLVQKHATNPDHLCFEDLVFVGYDFDLIDKNFLSEKELTFLADYEAKCAALGTQVDPQPI